MLYSSEECAKKLSGCSEKLYDEIEKLAALRKRLQDGELNMDEFTLLSYALKQERCASCPASRRLPVLLSAPSVSAVAVVAADVAQCGRGLNCVDTLVSFLVVDDAMGESALCCVTISVADTDVCV